MNSTNEFWSTFSTFFLEFLVFPERCPFLTFGTISLGIAGKPDENLFHRQSSNTEILAAECKRFYSLHEVAKICHFSLISTGKKK